MKRMIALAMSKISDQPVKTFEPESPEWNTCLATDGAVTYIFSRQIVNFNTPGIVSVANVYNGHNFANFAIENCAFALIPEDERGISND